MFSFNTLIFSGPNKPSKGFSVWVSISSSNLASSILRIFAIRFTCTLAACTEKSGSSPLPLAVTKSTGISALFTSGLCTRNVSIRA